MNAVLSFESAACYISIAAVRWETVIEPDSSMSVCGTLGLSDGGRIPIGAREEAHLLFEDRVHNNVDTLSLIHI